MQTSVLSDRGLAAKLRQLNATMMRLEARRSQIIKSGRKPVAVMDRKTGEDALSAVMTFFLDHQIESTAVQRVLIGLESLSKGSSLPQIFKPLPASHRRRDPPQVEGIKGRLAAVVEYLQQSGQSRKVAIAWVIRELSKSPVPLSKSKSATVDSWLVKWGGDRGATDGAGREGYLAMRRLLRKHKPSEVRLKRFVVGILKGHPA